MLYYYFSKGIKMKFWSFIKWKFSKTTIGDACYWSGAILIGSSFFVPASINDYLLFAGLGIWLVGIFKFVIWEKYKRDYQDFSTEQNKLFTVIKNSDQK